MSLDLTILLPSHGPRAMGDSRAFCRERLNLDGDYRIFSQIMDMSSWGPDFSKPTIKAIPIPPQLWIEVYEETGIEKTREDRHGMELTFVYAKNLRKLSVPDDTSPKNKAIKAFIDALPEDMPIILYWH